MAKIIKNIEAEKEIKSNELVVIDFFASWCGPCQMFMPIFDESSQKNKDIKMFKMDIDNEIEYANKVGVQGVPTIVAFKDGKEIKRFSGYKSLEDLEEFINSVK